MFPPSVERWRVLAGEESNGLPVDLVLVIVQRESGGSAGLVSRSTVPSSYTSSEMAACGLPYELRNRDLGLMQIGPSTWRGFVARTGSKITPCDLASKTAAGARLQLRAGCSIFRDRLELVRTLEPGSFPWPAGPLTDDHVLLGRLAYAFGWDGLRGRWNAAIAAGYPHTFGGLEAHHGTPAAVFRGARAILEEFRSGGSSSGSGSPRPPWRPPARPGSDAGAGVLLLLAAGLLAYGAATRRRSAT